MWIWDSSWSSSCFLIKKEQNQKEYLLITKRIYLLPRQRLEKKSIYCKCFLQVCRFQAINRGCYNSHTHTKNIHCVASNSFWWIRHWFCWMLGELWILNILSGTDTSCIPQLVWNLSRWAEPKPQGALGNPLKLEWGGLCCVGWGSCPLQIMTWVFKTEQQHFLQEMKKFNIREDSEAGSFILSTKLEDTMATNETRILFVSVPNTSDN